MKRLRKMEKVSSFIGKYMAWIVLVIAAVALFWPGTCLWIQTKWINYLLMIVMFGMGLTMKLGDFAVVFRQPRDVIAGCLAQFIVMPLLAFGLGRVFGLSDALPSVSVTAICLIVAAVVSHNSEKIRATGLVIFAVVILHNILGYLCGYLVGIAFRMDLPRKKAVAIEIGMQNSGLATTLAGSAFPGMAMATVPGAIFSVWHNISGAVLAGIFQRMGEE